VARHKCPGIGTERVLSGTKMISHVAVRFCWFLGFEAMQALWLAMLEKEWPDDVVLVEIYSQASNEAYICF